MKNQSKIYGYFKRQNTSNNSDNDSPAISLNVPAPRLLKSTRVQISEFDSSKLERDPRLCRQIWDYHVDLHDMIRRAYITAGPYQPKRSEYPKYGEEVHPRGFCYSWFESLPSWLEYPPQKMQLIVSHVFSFTSNLIVLGRMLSQLMGSETGKSQSWK